MESARAATPEDLPALGDLARQAMDELEPLRGGAVWRRFQSRAEPVEASLAEAIAAADELVLVGTIDDTPVGYATVGIEHLRDGGRLAVIEDIFVDPGARGVGVGEALMVEVIAWCRDRECLGVDALALPGHRDTKNFFETFGLTARAIVVHRALLPTAAPEA